MESFEILQRLEEPGSDTRKSNHQTKQHLRSDLHLILYYIQRDPACGSCSVTEEDMLDVSNIHFSLQVHCCMIKGDSLKGPLFLSEQNRRLVIQNSGYINSQPRE